MKAIQVMNMFAKIVGLYAAVQAQGSRLKMKMSKTTIVNAIVMRVININVSAMRGMMGLYAFIVNRLCDGRKRSNIFFNSIALGKNFATLAVKRVILLLKRQEQNKQRYYFQKEYNKSI